MGNKNKNNIVEDRRVVSGCVGLCRIVSGCVGLCRVVSGFLGLWDRTYLKDKAQQ